MVMNKELEELRAKQERAERQVLFCNARAHTYAHTNVQHKRTQMCAYVYIHIHICVWECVHVELVHIDAARFSVMMMMYISLGGFCALVASDLEGDERAKSQR